MTNNRFVEDDVRKIDFAGREMSADFRLVLGTNNSKKRSELVQLLRSAPISIQSLADFDPVPEAEETGATFAENAAIKATYYAQALGRWVLAEDSGLSVAALDGAPGVFSARFSGEYATDESNNKLLLEKLNGVDFDARTAWYTCHIALSDPNGKIHARSESYCQGVILEEGRGSSGFGYDPLFQIREYKKSFGELGDSVKSILSHRGRAYRKILPHLLANAQSVRN